MSTEMTSSIESSVDKAKLVRCSGSGLQFCYVNLPNDVIIDTRLAGLGELSVFCDSPSSDQSPARCQLADNQHPGLSTLIITPQVSGLHSLHIRYDDVNILGSPFSVWVSSASLVRVSGPGIEHGVITTFKAVFDVDATDAGRGNLKVRVGGRRGTFNVHTKAVGRRVLCSYHVTEPGQYTVDVTWSGDPVPKSPFSVFVFQDEEQLSVFRIAESRTPSTSDDSPCSSSVNSRTSSSSCSLQ